MMNSGKTLTGAMEHMKIGSNRLSDTAVLN
jgi:hypothetical protein